MKDDCYGCFQGKGKESKGKGKGKGKMAAAPLAAETSDISKKDEIRKLKTLDVFAGCGGL